MLAVLKQRRSITERDHLYILECPVIASSAKPGQFVEVRVGDGMEPYLRRPISIFSVEGTCFSLLVRTVGHGTALMEKWEPGAKVDVIGPLGNGFTWQKDDKSFLLIGGGIGAAPLNFLARLLANENHRVHMLFSPLREKALLDCFYSGTQIEVSFAENRSRIPDVLSKLLSTRPDRVFACGPTGMMKMVAESGIQNHVPTQISMEANMACGIGICLGCAIPIRSQNGFTYKKVCHDGPVFWGEEMIFDEQA